VDCDALRDDQWERLKALVPGGPQGQEESTNKQPLVSQRSALDGALGWRWRDLPARLGDYHAVKRRYYRWIAMGVLEAMFEALAREADMEWLMIDSTIVRAHQQAAGARKKKGGRRAWAAPAAV
jgi:transposase